MPLRHLIRITASVLATLCLPGCADNDGSCRPDRGMFVSFHSKTPCQGEPVYPAGIKSLTVCVFDSDDTLVAVRQLDDVALSGEYAEFIGLAGGLYTVLAWSGLDETRFDVDKPEVGVTKKETLYFRLRRERGLASPIDGLRVYQGESRAVYVPDSGATGAAAAVNMLETTNRLTVSVEGLPGGPEGYEIDIESDSGSMNLDGSIAGDEPFKYYRTLSYDDGILTGRFTLLKLDTGRTNTLVVRGAADGRELYRGSLLGTLILKNPLVDLRCDHDFTIRFTGDDQCCDGTYAITKIWVNNWLVHSYGNDL